MEREVVEYDRVRERTGPGRFNGVHQPFRQIYVFVVMHQSSRRLLHFNVTSHPAADWTLQQLRQTFGTDEAFRYLPKARRRTPCVSA